MGPSYRTDRKSVGVFLFVGISLLVSPHLEGFDAPAYFEKNCSSCHTIGSGDDVGPDLKGVVERRRPEWLIPFIQSSQTVVQSGDPVAIELFNKFKQKKMPDQDLKSEEVRSLLDFIATGGPGTAPIDTKPATQATALDIVHGRHLFLGEIHLANGGPACIACHSAANVGPLGGGTLGLNLTQVFSKYEDKPLSKALKKPVFPIMREIYADKPLTDDEIFAIKAFLYQVDQEGEASGNYRKKFVFLGLGGSVLMLGVTDFIWRKRRRNSTKPWARRMS